MSLGEKLYLAGILFLFASFMVVVGTLSWLDARDERINRRREKASQAPSPKPEPFITGATAHH